MELGQGIKTIRKLKRLTRKETACRVGVSITALYNIETGLSMPSQRTLNAICDALGVLPSYLMLSCITPDEVPEEKRSTFILLKNYILDESI